MDTSALNTGHGWKVNLAYVGPSPNFTAPLKNSLNRHFLGKIWKRKTRPDFIRRL